ncbi:hypothetical protein [Actinomadura violacea]|uniref:Uncharacterized protein n=1 Tax=Actinomadura violacea TaxID=2819934 RepID=A0ABS3RX84_9ACTN|nr:hypothetical protein [Actinomadura violacea]MBO2461256.1 hypothetical protein [Actinomadura violacea]
MYEYGVYSFDGPRRFRLSFCRQFDIDRDGVGVLIQLRCEFEYEPAPALEALGAHHRWWCGMEDEPPLAVVLDEIGRGPEWAVVAAHRPAASSVRQEDVC